MSSTTSTTPTPSTTELTIGGLETVYDALATAIDAVGEERATLFLVKLALLNAQSLGEPAVFLNNLSTAQKNL